MSIRICHNLEEYEKKRIFPLQQNRAGLLILHTHYFSMQVWNFGTRSNWYWSCLRARSDSFVREVVPIFHIWHHNYTICAGLLQHLQPKHSGVILSCVQSDITYSNTHCWINSYALDESIGVHSNYVPYWHSIYQSFYQCAWDLLILINSTLFVHFYCTALFIAEVSCNFNWCYPTLFLFYFYLSTHLMLPGKTLSSGPVSSSLWTVHLDNDGSLEGECNHEWMFSKLCAKAPDAKGHNVHSKV